MPSNTHTYPQSTFCSGSLLKLSCLSLFLGALNKQGQKPQYLSLIHSFFQELPYLGRGDAACALGSNSIRGSSSQQNYEQRFGSGPVNWGWDTFLGERGRTSGWNPWNSLMDPVKFVLYLWQALHGEVSPRIPSSGADVLCVGFDQVTQMAVP